MLTGTDGQFAWDVLPGYYRVAASDPGCHAPGHPRRAAVVSEVLPIPPPIRGLVIQLKCPGVRRSPTRTTVFVLRVRGGSPSIAGAVVKPFRLGAVPGGEITFRSHGRVIGVVPLRSGAAQLLVPSSRKDGGKEALLPFPWVALIVAVTFDGLADHAPAPPTVWPGAQPPRAFVLLRGRPSRSGK